MYKIFIFLILFCSALEGKIHVLVSITPQKFLVERIGQDYVTIDVIVPSGANSHTYEPTPKQMIALQTGEIWFRLGENFEARMIPLLPKIRVIDQRDGIDLIDIGCGCCNIRDAQDPHIWLSPRLLKIQAKQIFSILAEHEPKHTQLFSINLKTLEEELDKLDKECSSLFAACFQKNILLSHPAFGYFCRDYGLNQLSIETEGREATPKTLTELIIKARQLNIKTIFLQKQHNPKGGKKIAKELGAKTEYIDPYVENVIENLRIIAKLFACS